MNFKLRKFQKAQDKKKEFWTGKNMETCKILKKEKAKNIIYQRDNSLSQSC